MQHVDPHTLPQVPAPVQAPVLDRRAKLLRWADLIEKSPRQIVLQHGLEYRTQIELDDRSMWPSFDYYGSRAVTAFALAAVDPVFKDAGLKGHAPGDAMRFFELTKDQLHDFSCNCGGEISQGQMAARIRAIANAGPGIVTAVRNFIGI